MTSIVMRRTRAETEAIRDRDEGPSSLERDEGKPPALCGDFESVATIAFFLFDMMNIIFKE
jgi:hypothetical protein